MGEDSAAPSLALNFEDPEMCSRTLSSLNTFRKGGQLCDVVLEVQGHNIPAHRALLACVSGVLYDLFSAPESADQHHFKMYPSVDYDSFLLLISYAYTARLVVPEKSVKATYKTARLLRMQSAADACAAHLIKNLTPQNCLGVRSFANKHLDTELASLTDKYIQANIDRVMKSPEFCSLVNIRFDIISTADTRLSFGTETGQERALCQLTVDWLHNVIKSSQLDELNDEPHLLYLNNINVLRDCLIDTETQTVELDNDLVKDYKKLAKHKQD